MKYLIVAKPGTIPIPIDTGANMLQGGAAWIKGKLADGSLDCVYNVFGGGGIAIGNAETTERMLADLLEYPLYPFFTWEVTPLMEFESSLNEYIKYYQRLSSM